jgi:hypothetical protein
MANPASVPLSQAKTEPTEVSQFWAPGTASGRLTPPDLWESLALGWWPSGVFPDAPEDSGACAVVSDYRQSPSASSSGNFAETSSDGALSIRGSGGGNVSCAGVVSEATTSRTLQAVQGSGFYDFAGLLGAGDSEGMSVVSGEGHRARALPPGWQ